MKRIIIGRSKEKPGENVVAINPDFLYLDTSVWIGMFNAYLINKERIIDEIGAAIGNNEFRLLVSTINVFELIRPHGDISQNFSPDHFSAIDYVRQTSVHQPTIITEQEVVRFVNKTRDGVRILDTSNAAINDIIEGFEQRKKGNTEWFQKRRKWWDECEERDRVLNLEADMYELSGIINYDSFSDAIKSRSDIISGPIEEVKVKKLDMVQKKILYKGKKAIPPEEEEIIKYIRHRIDMNLAQKYGHEKVSMVASNLGIVFPGWVNIAKDIWRASHLTISKVKKEFPGLYWQAKITYYNYYHGSQRAGGQMGDRNHAVYIPYCNYFGTSDETLVKALGSEFNTILIKDNIHLFKVSGE